MAFTLYGAYQYTEGELFSGIILPNILIQKNFEEYLLEECGELYPIHQSIPKLQVNIGNFFLRRYDAYDRMCVALSENYNPIHNYDRREKWTDTPDIVYTGSTVTKTSTTRNATATSGEYSDAKTEVDNNVSAINSEDYQPDRQSIDTSHVGIDREEEHHEGTKGNDSVTMQNNESGKREHDGHLYGNIGVTTSQQMIESELDLRKFDIYYYIAQEFEREFLIRVYN